MIGTAKLFTFIFILISKNYFVCSTRYKWDLTNSVNNVQLFVQFIDGIDNTYDQEIPGLDDEKRKFLFFYTIFVKYASEIANFWMINSNPEDACANLKVGFGAIAFKFIGDGLRYDKSMEQNIANEFNKNILCPEKQLPRAVVDQLLMLTFSFAVRLLMSTVFGGFPSIDEWQMKTLLSAYKILSSKSDANGIFPFKIIQSSADISHWSWTESEYTAEHKQYIQNFKFVLKLSDFSLTSFEVYKLLETILIDVETMDDKSNVRAVEQQPSALYTFVKHYFVEKLRKRTLKHFSHQSGPTSTKKLLRCELLQFGADLHVRVEEINYYDLRDDFKWDEFKDIYNYNNNTDGARKLELFDEPLTNYPKAIQIDVDKCKGVTQFAEALRKIVVDIEMDSDKNNDYSITTERLFKSNEFQFFLQILNDFSDKENIQKLKYFKKNFGRKKAFFEKPLNQFVALLDQIIGEYSYSEACKFKWNRWWNFEEHIPKFGQLFFEALKKYSGEVKYDGKDQLMSFPPKLAEHFLQRVYTTLTESKSIGEELDFVETMQNVASTEQFEFVRRKKIIPIKVNAQLFKLLFSLAFRLSLQIEQSDLAEKYLKAFGSAYNCIELDKERKKHSFFQFKINISHEIVEINLPNWKLPDYMQKENINELRHQKAKKTFDFLLSLSNCVPTFYEILKVAKKLGEIELPKDEAIGEMYNDDHQNWLFLSNSKIVFEIMKYLKPLHKRSKQIKIDIENEFCFLAHFVEYLLEEMATGNKIPKIESIEVAIGHFILVKEELCKEKSLENFFQKYFDENLANFDKAINLNIDFSPHNELRQIVRAIVEEIEQILKNDNWNFAHLNFTKIVEWNLLEYDLHKIGNDQKWEEIEHLRGESQNAYSNWYSEKNEEEKFNYKEMKKLIKVLRGI